MAAKKKQTSFEKRQSLVAAARERARKSVEAKAASKGEAPPGADEDAKKPTPRLKDQLAAEEKAAKKSRRR